MKNKIKVSFFPYKASMWGSFDSVYKACLKDENCDVKVIPIPYYDIKNLTFQNLHFDGFDLYPKDVVIQNFYEYKLEEEKPDIAFIHNPYDNFNLVTSIHPDYFSEKLFEHSKKLVYIPYYNVRYEHAGDFYCQLRCFKYIWRMFLQSEKNCQYYRENCLSPEKVVGLGSPKSDYIVNYKYSKDDIPEDWAKKTKDKKVFFYNTHIQKILLQSDSFFSEFEKIYSIFNGSKDLALIWRPHPFTELFHKIAIDEEKINTYKKFIEQFQNSDNIIVDQTGDYRPAFSISDAYLGDESSLILEFGLTGKPICINSAAIKMIMRDFKPEQIYFDYNSLYQYSTPDEIFNFIDLVKTGSDHKKNERMLALKQILTNLDGKNGQRIWDLLKKDFLSETSERS